METTTELINWAWGRHHNEWSWYIRPLVLLGFCAAAWFRSYIAVIGMALFFPISAVIFPPPKTPKPYVVEFLIQERQFLEGLSPLGWALFVGSVAVFLYLLAASLWKRSFWYGIVVANIGGVLKLLVSVFLWKEVGQTAILPTISTAVIFNACAIAAWYWYRNLSQPDR